MSRRYEYVTCHLCGHNNTSKNMMRHRGDTWMCRSLIKCAARQEENDNHQEVHTMTQNPEVLREQAARLLKEADRAELRMTLMPKEPKCYTGKSDSHVQPVIIFRKQFRPGGPVYDYAALGCFAGWLEELKWYTTGPQQGGRTWSWEDLMNWIGEDFWGSVDVVYGTPQ